MLSLFSVSDLPKLEFKLSDKLLHAAFYLILTWTWFFSFSPSGTDKKRENKALIVIAVIIAVYGMIIEALQGILPFGRTADWRDIVANVIGILLAVFAIKRILSRSKSLKREN
ncbi:teicoplanin resistance protein VanZ [Leptobacterium flavescens]|uniref:Teicoplanin resistance protein VanZ n=1 Tax=Leptobacterium flavescens TaxID=472055 RepID=A0A6P0UQJ5_9FLAO|nr:VanZ family protein [Leptobacterium flavescens]NER12666.1 teicoplanin resistance protein VanZ [Leptobacterium flavescens]